MIRDARDGRDDEIHFYSSVLKGGEGMKRQRRNRKGQAFLIAEACTFDRTARELARDLAEMLRAWGQWKGRASRQNANRPTEADMERSMKAAEEAAKRVAARRRPSGRV